MASASVTATGTSPDGQPAHWHLLRMDYKFACIASIPSYRVRLFGSRLIFPIHHTSIPSVQGGLPLSYLSTSVR